MEYYDPFTDIDRPVSRRHGDSTAYAAYNRVMGYWDAVVYGVAMMRCRRKDDALRWATALAAQVAPWINETAEKHRRLALALFAMFRYRIVVTEASITVFADEGEVTMTRWDGEYFRVTAQRVNDRLVAMKAGVVLVATMTKKGDEE
jgi:hypothetical protein